MEEPGMGTATEAAPEVLEIEAADYLDLPAVTQVAPRWRIAVVPRAFRPDVEDRQRDWVATVAVPAFKLLRADRGAAACRRFLALGTGTGVDALAAIEVLGAAEVGLTDLFEEVVEAATCNVRRNLRPGEAVTLHAGAGDLVEPLRQAGVGFDLVYENLPNLPLADAADLAVGRTSASFVPPRPETVPRFIADWLLTLHYLALVESRDILAPDGALIATIGARFPFSVLADMAGAAGYAARALTYGWKAQTEPEALLPVYAGFQERGLGPFHFFPAERLRAILAGHDAAAAGRDVEAIEQALAPDRLDAVTAWKDHRRGVRIGHAVVVLHATPR
jgi:SAM-dependent methyltransferase